MPLFYATLLVLVLLLLLFRRLMLRHRLDAIGLESDPNSSALRDAAEDTSSQRVLELMLTPDGSKEELMGTCRVLRTHARTHARLLQHCP
jgi:hypothetical protein